MRTFFISLLSFFLGYPALASEVTFGKLPTGAISTNVVSDVHAEICRDHLFDPALAAADVPTGYRLTLAKEAADKDPDIATLLKGNSKLASHAMGSLCFMSVGSFVIDGVRVRSASATPMAFWWAQAIGPRDARMQGKVEWLQVASWYSKDVADKPRILATDPMAQFTDLAVTQTAPNQWRIRLVLPKETIEAEVQASGQRKKRNALQPGSMSVPFAGKQAGAFWVISYYGHHHQSAEGVWRTKGTGVFSEALQIPGEASVFRTIFQDGWSALSGLYGPEKK